MFEAKLKYTDYNDVEREETFYFHLNQTELRKLETSKSGGLSAMIERLMEIHDITGVMELFYKIIDLSYGVKDADGRGFHKSPEILESFKSTEAYSDFAERLLNDAEYASKFIAGIMPKKLRDQVKDVDKSKLSEQQKKALEMFEASSGTTLPA